MRERLKRAVLKTARPQGLESSNLSPSARLGIKLPKLFYLTASAKLNKPMEPNHISIEDFFKVELKMGKILSAEKVEGSEKLLKLMIDLGEEKPRQILSGVAKVAPEPESIVGKMVPVIANLAPRMMMGMESQGMMLCADDGMPVLLHPSHDVPPGSIVK